MPHHPSIHTSFRKKFDIFEVFIKAFPFSSDLQVVWYLSSSHIYLSSSIDLKEGRPKGRPFFVSGFSITQFWDRFSINGLLGKEHHFSW
ncbi:uncharacterized protein METZ01_LOCUS456660 [marine metagenome]|uniref:Uncharacterized protein n=1 Tax=marine metagenome TaxID=408172 RepID=A0A383A7G7_9ZZZZ|tara:strand:- start:218 stop:484 length:267 start_codon:yes stop_codon:yes gene_type:complete